MGGWLLTGLLRGGGACVYFHPIVEVLEVFAPCCHRRDMISLDETNQRQRWELTEACLNSAQAHQCLSLLRVMKKSWATCQDKVKAAQHQFIGYANQLTP